MFEEVRDLVKKHSKLLELIMWLMMENAFTMRAGAVRVINPIQRNGVQSNRQARIAATPIARPYFDTFKDSEGEDLHPALV